MNARIPAAGLALALLAPGAASAGWRNLGPGGGGWIPAMAVSPAESNVIFAGCDVGGFYRSDDAGATWTIGNAGLHDLYVECIVPHPSDPRVIHIGTEGGVHRSDDGGRTWTWQREGFPPPELHRFSAPVGALALDPGRPDTLYAGIGRPRWRKDGRGEVWRTDDGGAHWRLANPGGGGMDRGAVVRSLVVHPADGRRLLAATDRGLYRSDDAGATWRTLTNGLPHRCIQRVALCEARPDVLYATLRSEPGVRPWQGGVYRSDDGGATWVARLEGLGSLVGQPGAPEQMTSNVDRLAVHPTDPDTVYAGDAAWVSAGVWRTTDGGRHWALATRTRPRGNLAANMDYGWIAAWGPAVMGLALDPRAPSTLYFSTSGHAFRSGDRGDTWQQVYSRRAELPAGAPAAMGTNLWRGTGLEVTCVHRIVVHPRDPRRLFLCYADIGLLQSADGGRTFARTVRGMKCDGNAFTVAFDPADPQTVFAGTGWWNRNAGDVCRSDDGGFTWRVVGEPATGLPDGQTRHLLADRAGPGGALRVTVGVAKHGVYASANGGTNWVACNEGLPADATICGLAHDPRRPAGMLALVTGDDPQASGVYARDGADAAWRRAGGGAAVWGDPQALAVGGGDPPRFYVAARERYADGRLRPGGVFASRDGGATWTRVLEDRFIQGLAVDPADADSVFAGGMDHPYHDGALGSGVRHSRDGGRTWTTLNTPDLTTTKIASLTVDPHDPHRLYAGTSGNGVFVWEEPR